MISIFLPQLLQNMGIATPLLKWWLPIIGTAGGLALVIYGQTIDQQPSNITIIPRKGISFSQKITLRQLNRQVEKNHRHSDLFGITSDYQDGKPMDDLMNYNCKICLKPRNKRI